MGRGLDVMSEEKGGEKRIRYGSSVKMSIGVGVIGGVRLSMWEVVKSEIKELRGESREMWFN
ncbi:hypothetical protein [Clostridioides difficile]|uniref:hypothetical protein n=1 Tax=Clostridioides difficile TaxID=1496 RepID=UPI001A9BC931|nr:hypothetical protein [Clostridioides difficile]